MPTTITSLQNPRVKQVLRLRHRRHREHDGLLLVEGRDELDLALSAGIRPQTLYVCPELLTNTDADLLRRAHAAGAEVIDVSRPVFDKLAYRENPDGWLAIVPAQRRTLADLALGRNPLLLIAEAIEKPGNLGALLRSADAAGATAVIVCDPTTDVNNPNVVRSSRGTLFTVALVEAGAEEAFAWLDANGVSVIAASPDADLAYTQVDLRGPVALAVGAEHQGLSQAWLRRSAFRVRIPMLGRVNSLNVATAATLLLYEAVRQRRA